MITDLDLDKNINTEWTFSTLYEYIQNNITHLLKNPELNTFLNPENNSTTKKLLEEENEEIAYSTSYFITLVLLLDFYGIKL